jgi:hypothetical protein
MRVGCELSHEGQPIGRDPRLINNEDFREIGHVATPILSVIRAKCLDCCCYQPSEIRKCTATGCALWPYRMGTNPFRAAREMSDEQRSATAERLKQARLNKVSAAA